MNSKSAFVRCCLLLPFGACASLGATTVATGPRFERVAPTEKGKTAVGATIGATADAAIGIGGGAGIVVRRGFGFGELSLRGVGALRLAPPPDGGGKSLYTVGGHLGSKIALTEKLSLNVGAGVVLVDYSQWPKNDGPYLDAGDKTPGVRTMIDLGVVLGRRERLFFHPHFLIGYALNLVGRSEARSDGYKPSISRSDITDRTRRAA